MWCMSSLRFFQMFVGEKMKDFLGNEIKVHNIIVLASKVCNRVKLNKGIVIEVRPHDIVCYMTDNTRNSYIKRTDRCIVVG